MGNSDKLDYSSTKIFRVIVDRREAVYSTWYEMFHRSQGKLPSKSATFRDCEERLAEIKHMGFDVIYLPPIHPIGRKNRRGPNNTPSASESRSVSSLRSTGFVTSATSLSGLALSTTEPFVFAASTA